MNPIPLLLWLITGLLLGLGPWLALGWRWWTSFLLGMVCAPPFLWTVGAILDAVEQRPRAPSGRGLPTKVDSQEWLHEPAPACPRCGALESTQVLYGLPAMTEALEKAIDEKRVVLAGCPVYGGAPRWICRDCGEKHGMAVPDEQAEDEGPLRRERGR